MSRKRKPKSRVTPGPDHFMREAYKRIDTAVAKKLTVLQEVEGITVSCRNKCSACCHQVINVLIPEAEIIGRYIKKKFSRHQAEETRAKVVEWSQWVRNELNKYVNDETDEASAIYDYAPPCPLLKNDSCSVYPVRPVVCRTHFVSSDPKSCLPETDPNAAEEEPDLLYLGQYPEINSETMRIRRKVEQKVSFEEGTMLLPFALEVIMK